MNVIDVTNPRDFLSAWRQRLSLPDAFTPCSSYLRQVAGFDRKEASMDRYGARHSALRAIDSAAQKLGYQGSMVADIDHSIALQCLDEAPGHLRPSALPLAPERTLGIDAVRSQFDYIRVPEFYTGHLYNPGKDHVWLEERAKRFFQYFGRIYPHPVTFHVGDRRRNFDFFMVSDHGQAVGIEVMNGLAKYSTKLGLARDFATRGAKTLFIGYAPPGLKQAPYPRTLWSHAHGPFIVTHGWVPAEDDKYIRHDYRLAPDHPNAFYLSEPELCDALGRPLIETSLCCIR
jgi:hypothetical protein